MLRTPCPAPAKLEALVLGLPGDGVEGLERHVAGCRRCGQQLLSLTGDDELSRALRRPLPSASAPWRGRAEALIPVLKRFRPRDAGATRTAIDPGGTHSYQTGPRPTAGGPDAFPFLSPAREPDEIGRLGPYRVLAVIGVGGMGVVFRAEDPHLERLVALKVVKPQAAASAGARARFVDEARALARLEHDFIVTAYQAAEDNGVPYLAMPLLAGRSLQDRLNEAGGPVDVEEVLRVGREVATGLAFAHARGFVHRDVKPANIWLECRPAEPPGAAARVKILDFGLAQALTDARAVAGGTPAYMAPEQAAGAPVSGRADVFSLGCVLYAMAAGRRPFDGPSITTLLLSVARDEPPAVRDANPAVPVALERLIARLMSKRPGDRPEAEEAVAALRRIEESRRPGPSRRAWLAGAAAATGAAGLAARGARRLFSPVEPPAPERPGELTIEYDEPDGRIVLRRDGDERTADVVRGKPISLPPGEYALRTAVAIDKRTLWPASVVVGSGEKRTVAVRLIGEVAAHREHGLPVGGVAVVEKKGAARVLSAGRDRVLIGWSPAAKGEKAVTAHEDGPLRCVAVGPDGRTVATGCGDVGPRAVQAVRFWDAETLERRPGELTCGSQVNALALSPTPDRLVSAENDGALVLWDTRRAVALARVDRAHGGSGAFAVAFLPDGKRVLTAGGDGAVVERTAADLAPVRALAGHTKPVRGLAVLAGATHAASAGDDATVRVWDLATGKAREWAVPAAVLALAASPDGTRLLTGDAAGAVRLWDVAAGREVVRFDGHAKAVNAVAFAPDGRRAVSGGRDGTVRLWELPK